MTAREGGGAPRDDVAEDQPSFEAQALQRMQAIADDVLTYSERVMRSGTPKAKNDFIKGVFPTLYRTLTADAEDADAEIEDLKKKQAVMMAGLADQVPVLPTVPHVVAPEDFPRQ